MSRPSDHPHASLRRFRLAAALIRWRYLVAASALTLTIACAFPALELIRLHLKTNIFGLLPKDTPSVQTLTAMIDKAGGWGDLMVVVDGPDEAANRRFIEALDATIAGLPWVNYTEHRLDTAFFERNGLLLVTPADLDLIERRLRDRYEFEVRRRDPTYVDLLGEEPPEVSFEDIEARYRRAGILRPFHGSADGTTLVLAIYPVGLSGEIKESRRRVAELEAAIAALDPAKFAPGLRVRVGGTFRDRVEEYDLIAIAEDLRLVRHRAARPHRAPLPSRRRNLWLASATALGLLGLVGVSRIGFEYDLDKLRTRVSPESAELRQRIAGMFSGIRDPVVVLAGDLKETAEIQSVLRRTLRPGAEGSRVQAVVSILDLVPADQQARLERIGRIRSLVDEIEPFAPEPEREQLASFRRRLVNLACTLVSAIIVFPILLERHRRLVW